MLKGRGQRYIFKETRILLIITIHSPKTLSLKYKGGAFGRSEGLTNIYICMYVYMYAYDMHGSLYFNSDESLPYIQRTHTLSLSLSLSLTYIHMVLRNCVSQKESMPWGRHRIWSRVPVHRFGWWSLSFTIFFYFLIMIVNNLTKDQPVD